jgi:hypothetical protein
MFPIDIACSCIWNMEINEKIFWIALVEVAYTIIFNHKYLIDSFSTALYFKRVVSD